MYDADKENRTYEMKQTATPFGGSKLIDCNAVQKLLCFLYTYKMTPRKHLCDIYNLAFHYHFTVVTDYLEKFVLNWFSYDVSSFEHALELYATLSADNHFKEKMYQAFLFMVDQFFQADLMVRM